MKSPQNTIFIVKKQRGHGGGHHGGAWKVAYADFVTAMMAFFLVMWLVSQSKDVRAAVAGYFREPGVFDYEHGRGMLPGGTPGVEPNGAPKITMVDEQAQLSDQKQLKDTAEKIREDLRQTAEFKQLRDQVEVTTTSEGLRIEMVERSGSSFFASGSAVLLGESVKLLGVIAQELKALTNDIVVEGHTDSRQYTNGEKYGNWELSADRANAARRVIEQSGLNAAQIRGVRGYADTQLHLPSAPLDARNRRVSIVVRSKAPQQTTAAGVAGTQPAPAPTPPSSKPAPPEAEQTR